MPRKVRELESSDEDDDVEDSGSDDASSSDGSDVSSAEEEDGDGGRNEDDAAQAREQKHKLVEGDLNEIRRMIDEMDKIKMRIAFRLNQSQASSRSRRSSVQDIVIPKETTSTAVQTSWDASRAFVTEKVVGAHDDAAPVNAAPEADSVRLRLQDLAKSYGMESAAAPSPAPPTRVAMDEIRPPVLHENDATSMSPHKNSTEHFWDGVNLHQEKSRDAGPSHAPAAASEPDLMPLSEAQASQAPPPQSGLFASLRRLSQTFGLPVSPTSSGVSVEPSTNAEHNKEKTEAQKELEAAKELLFF
ncbi:hypothetical protein PINS_up001790 [Pythium insidiosum]|nr:hypothetical protein PINS_up001790 [Pythium insidiosum]